MIASILAFLANIGIGSIATKIAAAYEAREKAKTDTARIQADERIKTLEVRRDVMVAEGASGLNAAMRFALALGPALYLLKVFAIDKVVCSLTGAGALGSGWCRTDPLSPELWEVVVAVIGFYFLATTATTVARIIKR